jgi:hypothetical protein
MNLTDFIKDKLFLNSMNIERLDDCLPETDSLREYVHRADILFSSQNFDTSLATRTGVINAFLSAIIDYAKAACDNIYLGHFSSANTLCRIIIENAVCLHAMTQNESLWELWLIHSIEKAGRLECKLRKDTPKNETIFDTFKTTYQISAEYQQVLQKSSSNYRWAYQYIGQGRYTFKALADKVDSRIYKDYSLLSDFSHGASATQMFDRFIFADSQHYQLTAIAKYVQMAFDDSQPNLADILREDYWAFYDSIINSDVF